MLWLLQLSIAQSVVPTKLFSKMKRIAILGLHSDCNLGDPLICQIVMKLYQKYSNERIEWTKVDLRFYHASIIRLFQNKKRRLLYLFFHWFFKRLSFFRFAFIHDMRIKYLSYEMEELIKGANCALIAGGGIIHYKYHDYYAGICSFILACQRNHIPLAINAVGVEGFDKEDPKCKMFIKYLNSPIIKIITTRDDIDTINNSYINPQSTIPVLKTTDPAIFSNDFLHFPVIKDGKIGIGIIREDVFLHYKIASPVDLLYDYYTGLVIELEKRGIEYEFFTNGLNSDLGIVSRIEKNLNRSLTVRVPHDTQDLLSIIASYRGIISARMHSCIVAYSFNLPAIAFNWNSKLRMWFSNIGEPDCCFELNNLNPVSVVDMFLEAESRGRDMNRKITLKIECLNTIQKTLELLNL